MRFLRSILGPVRASPGADLRLVLRLVLRLLLGPGPETAPRLRIFSYLQSNGRMNRLIFNILLYSGSGPGSGPGLVPGIAPPGHPAAAPPRVHPSPPVTVLHSWRAVQRVALCRGALIRRTTHLGTRLVAHWHYDRGI